MRSTLLLAVVVVVVLTCVHFAGTAEPPNESPQARLCFSCTRADGSFQLCPIDEKSKPDKDSRSFRVVAFESNGVAMKWSWSSLMRSWSRRTLA